MKGEYREISADLLALARGNAWSIENMEAHEAGGRSVDYIGSRAEGKQKPGAEMVERKADNEEICSRSRDSRKAADKISTSKGRSDSTPELYYGQV